MPWHDYCLFSNRFCPLEDLSIKVEVQGLNGFFLPRVSPLNCLLSEKNYMTVGDIRHAPDFEKCKCF